MQAIFARRLVHSAKTLIREAIKQNYDPVYVSHPGTKRTHDLIELHYWSPGMKKSTEYTRNCDPCQRREGNCEYVAPLGDVKEPTAPFREISIEVSGTYISTPRGNIYLLSFMNYFTKYAKAFEIADQTAETWRWFTQQKLSHNTAGRISHNGSRPSVSLKTRKVLGIRRPRTASHQPVSNGMWHKDLHTALSHYIISANTNWVTILPFFLMAKWATPHSGTAYGPSYLLHGRDTQLRSNDSLKAHYVKRI